MKVAAPALLPILRSDTVGDLLARLYLSPDERVTLSDLAKALGVSLPTVVREVDRMVASGLLEEERVGRARRVWPNSGSVLFEPLSTLVALTYGPKPVLERLLADVPGVERAFVYGSWAARYRGEEGSTPNDVDVLVVGSADPDDMFEIAEQARQMVRRAVDIRSVRPEVWDNPAPGNAFLRHVRSRPLVELEIRGSER
jgi:predicted nucleotidyltransferase